MRLRVDPPSDAFPEIVDDTDSLERVGLARSLSNLYASLEGSSVAILHGRWGVGKSTFARRWKNKLEQEGFGTIYLDAFAYDYMGEPFDALLSAVLQKTKGSEIEQSDRFKTFKDRAAAVSRALALTGVKAGVRVATLNLIDAADINALSAAASELSGDFAEVANDAAKKLLERRATDAAAFESFRSALDQIHVASAGKNTNVRSAKTVFIVDELDRCRPDFALSLIESLKHFFQTEGLHFVLVTNKYYLAKSVDARYGLKEQSDEYLQKFYDFVINFEQKSQYDHQHAAASYSKKMIERLMKDVKADVRFNIASNVGAYAIAFDLTLRQVEHIVTNLSLAYLALDDRRFSPAHLITALAFLKAIHLPEYTKIKHGLLDFRSVKEIFRSGRWPESYNVDRLIAVLQFHMDDNIDQSDQRFSSFDTALASYMLERRQVLPFLANGVLDNFARS
jgi:putative ribosome biogenesis GTPase RsgA